VINPTGIEQKIEYWKTPIIISKEMASFSDPFGTKIEIDVLPRQLSRFTLIKKEVNPT